jgi:hypothetical protein
MLASRALAVAGPAGSPFLAYLRLEVRRSLRNRRYLVFTIAFPVMLYVLYTAILPAAGNEQIDGLAWPLYFLVSMAAYGAMGAAMSGLSGCGDARGNPERDREPASECCGHLSSPMWTT